MYLSNINPEDVENIYNFSKKNIHIFYKPDHLRSFIYNDGVYGHENVKLYKLTDKKNNLIGKLYGYIIFEVNSHNIHIMSLAIDSKYRKKGLGSDLIKFVKNKYPNHSVTLNVLISNTNAINFYIKNNFKIAKYIKNYYTSTNEDAFLMISN